MIMRITRGTAIGILVGIVAILVLAGLAIAGIGDDDDDSQATASPTAAASATRLAATATATAQPSSTSMPAASPSPDAPVSATPIPDGSASPGPSPALPAFDLVTIPADRIRIDAPIDAAEVLFLESFPVQYVLHVNAGLPNGCAEVAGWEASRAGSAISVKVYDSLPAGDVVCTQIYGMYEVNIPLGTDYVSGETYTVQVNDLTITFTAQ